MKERILWVGLMSRPLLRLTIMLLFFGATNFNPIFAQPANDDCNSSIAVPTDGSCVNGDNFLATPDVGNGSCVANGAAAPNIWFSFVAAGMDYDISAFGGLGFTPEITLIQFQGTPCDFASAVEIDCGAGNIVGMNVLNPGQQYYVSITELNGSQGQVSVCVNNPVDPPAPPNDNPCSSQPIPADGSCTTGTTLNGNQDWANPNCPNLGETSVWYQVTLAANSNSLDVVIGNQSITGDVSAMVGTFAPDCTGGFGFVEQYCGPAGANFTASGLTPGATYWIVISTEEVNAGMFDICVTENGPPPACAAIDLCSGAEDISTPFGTINCVTGCNTGTAPDVTGGAGCFDFSSIPTVWYTFTTDGNTDFVNLDLNSPEFDLPQIAVFEGSCASWALIDCSQGAGGAVNLQQVDVTPNTTYYIAVGSIGGQDGNFNLCMTTVPSGGTNCTAQIDFNVTNASMGSPPSGPFQAGEEITVCMDVTYSSANNNCQWLHGIVPEFGDCWDPISFNADGSPVTATLPGGGGTWGWYLDGDVLYNNVPGGPYTFGSPVGAGWFITGVAPNPVPAWCNPGDHVTDPNCSWGIPMGCGTQQVFQFCVTLTTKSYPECDNGPAIDCGINVRVFSDGETGGWVQTGCQLDVPWSSNYSLNCCEPPEMVALPQQACSDVQLDVFLDDFLTPPAVPGNVTYTWTVSAPSGVTGASDCPGQCGTILSQILVNTTGAPQVVTYTITPRTIDGCLGFPTDLQITVLPEVVPSIQNPSGALCSGSCALLFGSATGGIPPYSYDWSNGDSGLTTEVCPTFTTSYFLTVTDGNDCTGVEEIIVEANPNLDVTIVASPNILELCDSDPQFPVTLTAFADIGGPAWIYNWELANGQQPSIPIVQAITSGTYYVTLTDLNGCTGENEIDIIVHPAPTIIIFPVDPQCEGGAPVPLTVITIPAGGTGTWSGNVNADDSFVPDTPGQNEVCYDFVDDNGCPAQDCIFIQVNPVPSEPVISTFEPTVCATGTGYTYCVDPVATADTYNWTFPAGVTITSGAGTTCVTVDWNNATAGDVCITAVNSCGESAPTCQAVTVESGPPAPTDLLGDLNPCENATAMDYSITAVPGATSYIWIITNGTLNGSGTNVTVDWGIGSSGEVCVSAVSDCGEGPQNCITITLESVPVSPQVPLGLSACQNENGVTYSIPDVPGATSYTWTVPPGASIASGQGSTSIVVDWGATDGSICVAANNDCGASTSTCLPVALESIPADAGPISGLDIICQNTNGEIYSVGIANGADTYTWTVPANVTIVSGQGTNSITVDLGIFSTGQICVTPSNDCGDSAESCFDISPNLVPIAPTQLQDQTECAGASGLSYTVVSAGATGYTWDLPSGVTMITGQGTGTIGFNLGSLGAGTYPVCVFASNDCGDGPQSCFDITVEDVPAAPSTDQLDDNICEGEQNANYSINSVPDATGYVWTTPAGTTITSGQGTTSIVVDWGNTLGGQICVAAENQCGQGPQTCFNVTAEQQLEPPTVSCDLNSTELDQVGFDVSHPIATDFTYTYSINNGPIQGPFPVTGIPIIVAGLSPNDEVQIFVTALANGNICGDSEEGIQSCTANDCVNNPPVINDDGAQFCLDSSPLQLTVDEPGGTWSGTGVNPTGLFDPAVAGVGPVIITYFYTDTNGCPQSGNITLTVNDFPVVNAGMEGLLSCAATEIDLNGAGSASGPGITYLWTGPGTIINETSLTPTINQTGLFTLVVTNSNTGCSASDDVMVNPDSNSPTADAGPMIQITCDNPMVTLQGSGTNGTNLIYLWTGPGINAGNENEPMPSVNLPGNYTLIVTNGDNGCESAPSTVVVDQAIPPVAEAGSAATFTCSTTSLPLDGMGSTTVGNITYLWTGPGNITNGTTLNPTVDAAGTYTLEVTDVATGCSTSDFVIVDPDLNAPTADAGINFTLTCNNPIGTLQGSGSATNMSYQWSGPNMFTSTDQNPMVSEAGDYFLIVTDTDNGCSSAAALVQVDQFQDPVAVAGTNATLTCAQPTLDLNGTGSTVDPNVTYLWSGPGTIINPTSLSPTVDVAGDFLLTVTDNFSGCTATDMVTILPDSNSPNADAGNNQLITCNDPQVTLQGTGTNGTNLTYEWSGPGITTANMNDQNPVVDMPGDYFLVVINNDNGCSSAGSMVVVDVPEPIIAIAGLPATLTCSDMDLQLNGTGSSTGTDYSYDWIGPGYISDANTLNPTITVAGIFTLTVTNNATGCFESASVEISPDLNAPSAEVGASPDITCLMSTVSITSTTDASNPLFTWTGPGITPGNMNDQNPVVDQAGWYFLLVENLDNGCSASNQILVNDLTTPPAAVAGMNQTLTCNTTSLDLNGTGSATGPNIQYLWTGPGTIINETTLNPTIDAAGTFTLTVTNILTGCFSEDLVDVNPDTDAPVAIVGPGGELDCNNDFEIQLQGSTTSTGNLLYTWSGPGITAANMNDQNPIVNLPGLYDLVISNLDNSCDGNVASVTLTEAQPPVAEITSGNINTLDCFVDNLTLVASGCEIDPNLIAEWFLNGSAISEDCQISIEGGANLDGMYELVILDLTTGCRDTASTMVTDNTAYPGAAAGEDQALDCIIMEVQLEGSSLQTGPTVSYNWSGPIILSDPTQPTITAGSQGEYILTVIESISGCINSDTVFVDDISTNMQASAGDDQNLDCTYAPVQLIGNGSGGSNLNFSWYNESGDLIGSTSEISVDEPGLYSLVVLNSFNGCDDQALVNVFPPSNLPVEFDLLVDNPDCPGDQNGFINVLQIVGGTQPFMYSFNDLPYTSNPIVTGIGPGTYSLVAEDSNGCLLEETIVIPPAPITEVVLDDQVTLQYGDSTTIIATITVPLDQIQEIIWEPANLVECLTDPCYEVEVHGDVSTRLRVTVITDSGCIAEDDIEVRVEKDFDVYFPNAFSPGGSGPDRNDRFRPFVNDSKVEKIEDFIIADRWGEVVYRRDNFDFQNPAEGWDGTLKDKALNPAVFVYYARVTFIDGNEVEYHGDVTLMR